MRNLIALLVLLSAARSDALDLSRHGITWTVTGSPAHGTYANGDLWVVGPITITAISPASTLVSGRTRHGSMINPTPNCRDQASPSAYDSALTYGAFSAALNVARPGGSTLDEGNPLVVPAGSSLMSSRSADQAEQRPQLLDLAILTVVASPPPAGSFRPPYCGSDKTHRWNLSDLDYSRLHNLSRAAVIGEPSLASVAGYLDRVWNEQDTEYTAEYIRAANNGPTYGRNMCYQLSPSLLSLQLDYSQEEKEPLAIRVVQYAIDILGVAKAGGVWYNNGGHAQGRKAVLGIGAAMLDDADMWEYFDAGQHFIFQEDQQTWYVEASDVGKTVVSTVQRPRVTYIEADIGIPEWGIQHYTQEQYDGRNWEIVYRDNVLSSVMPGVLVARLMGLADEWNWPPLFDYVDRGVAEEVALGPSNIGGTDELQTLDLAFWDAFRDAMPLSGDPLPDPPSAPSGLTVDATSATEITVSWTDNADDETGYELQRSTTSGSGYTLIAQPAADATSHADSGLLPGTTYYYRIRAANTYGTSAFTAEASDTTAEATMDLSLDSADVGTIIITSP